VEDEILKALEDLDNLIKEELRRYPGAPISEKEGSGMLEGARSYY